MKENRKLGKEETIKIIDKVIYKKKERNNENKGM